MNKIHEAVHRYSHDIQLIISCISDAVCFAYPISTTRYILSVTVQDELQSGAIQLRRHNAEPLLVDINQEIDFDNTASRFSTKYYLYSILDHEGTDLVGFHFHPELNEDPIRYPHIHIYAEAGSHFAEFNLYKRHIPSGRITLEDIIEWLILEFDVVPARQDWQTVLTQTKQRFIANRTWVDPPPT